MARKPAFYLFLIAITFFSSQPFLYAEESALGNYLANAGTKLGRGVLNVVTSPAEIPCTIHSEVKYGQGAWTGIGSGSLNMFKRFVVGATEIMTFMVPKEKKLPEACSKNARNPYPNV